MLTLPFRAQSDLAHQPTEVRVVLELADVRILALGTLHHPKSFYANKYAKMLLHPPGVEKPFRSSSDVNLPGHESLPHELEHIDEGSEESSPAMASNQLQVPESPASPPSLELEPTRSRESTHSISAAASALFPSVFRGRSWSTTVTEPATPGSSSTPSSPMRGISIFRTRSLDEHAGRTVTPHVGPSSPGILSRLAGVRGRRRMSLSPPPEGQVLQIEQEDPAQLPASPPTIPQQDLPLVPARSTTEDHSNARPGAKSPDQRAKAAGKANRGIGNGYPALRHPTPSQQFANYPNYTPGNADTRWKGSGENEEDGKVWAGPLLYVATNHRSAMLY